MASFCYQYLSVVANDFIFFSGDVQTTTIAVAIASSLCYSIVWAIYHVMRLAHPSHQRENGQRKPHSSLTYLPNMGAKFTFKRPKVPTADLYQDLIRFETVLCSQVEVPCVRCSKNLADPQCRFVTCKMCCFCPDACDIHKRPCDLDCRPCDHLNVITEINLSECQISQCPERIGYFGSQLSLLNLSGNNLGEVPEEIGCLRGLKEFYLQKNSIKTLPATLGSLSNLQILTVSSNQITSLPDFWLSLSNLQYLDISHNEICDVPDSVQHLQHLHTLLLQHNKFTSIPDKICQLKSLQRLDVSDNCLNSVPNSLGGLLRLEEFIAASCNLDTFPVSLCLCPSLRTINLSRNRLKLIPVEVGQVGNLRELNVSHNCLQYLPATLHINHLRICDISENPFLTEADHSDVQSLTQGPYETGNVPALFELAFRTVVSGDDLQFDLKALPLILQETVGEKKTCTSCGIVFLDLYRSSLHFQQIAQDHIPFLSQLCSAACAVNS
ncbi:leucine-rich repeat protein soc-2 homolog [Ylistrum balloti]|uniref:leucine-rich repeat protein soc-2 homolog n=1 Tax=Ylistrum balloti TaxID=509963 RepID=UPI00290591FB|nr:leucine-rich repeat protein soc-2 homolog [Ylistrum balloti]